MASPYHSVTHSSSNYVDDEEHRLNLCPKYSGINFLNDPEHISFDSVFSDDLESVKAIISRIQKVWNVKTGRGSMNV